MFSAGRLTGSTTLIRAVIVNRTIMLTCPNGTSACAAASQAVSDQACYWRSAHTLQPCHYIISNHLDISSNFHGFMLAIIRLEQAGRGHPQHVSKDQKLINRYIAAPNAIPAAAPSFNVGDHCWCDLRRAKRGTHGSQILGSQAKPETCRLDLLCHM